MSGKRTAQVAEKAFWVGVRAEREIVGERRPAGPALPRRGPGRRHLEPVELLCFVLEVLERAGWEPALHGSATVDALECASQLLGVCSVDWFPAAVLADELLVGCEEVDATGCRCGGQMSVSAGAGGELLRTCRIGHAVTDPR